MFNFHHVALSVTNIEKSVEFYKIFGFQEAYTYSDESYQIIQMKLGNSFLELFHSNKFELDGDNYKEKQRNLGIIGVKHFGLQVGNIQEIYEDCIKKGIIPESEVKHGRTEIDYFFIKDPDGLSLEIVQDDRNL